MMAWLRSGACAVFVLGAALLGGQVDAVVQFGACTDECLLAINLARTGKLNTRLNALAKDEALEGAASSALSDNTLAGAQENNCTPEAGLTPVTDNAEGVLHTFAHDAPLACPEFIQMTLEAGLNALANYKQQNWDGGVAAPFLSPAVQNLALIMFAGARGVGCAASTNCTGGTNLMLCRFGPSLIEAPPAPIFTEEFFKALGERQKRGINITTLTKDDLDTPLDAKGGDKSSGRISTLPGLVPAAMLTIASLLGFASFH